nr:hypothetical protein [Burkholderia pseudomallei]
MRRRAAAKHGVGVGFMSSPECPLDRRVALTRPAPAFFETVRDVAGTPCGARASSASHEPRAARDGKCSRGRALI